MAETFADVYRRVQLHCPLADLALCRTWVQWAYEEACKRRKVWSHLRTAWEFSTLASRSGTCSVTAASTTVTGSGLVFAATDVGRQFKVGSIPLYTIVAVSVAGATSATLDRAYAGSTDAAASGTVLDAYITAPLDFKRWIGVADPTNRMRLRWLGLTLERLDQVDPSRTHTGTPRALVPRDLSPVTAHAGRPRFELWPYTTSARTFVAMYYRKVEILDDEDTLTGPFADGGLQLLADGALSRAALWPGYEGRKNMYFNFQLAAAHETKFTEGVIQLEVQDEDLMPTWLSDPAYADPTIPWDSNFLQSHDGSLPDAYTL
jgi:hypothetical protein